VTIDPRSRIAIAGAGSIGCYIGASLAAAGRNVTLLVREALAEGCSRHGLHFSNLDGNDRVLPPGSIEITTDAAEAFNAADVVLVTVKCRDTRKIAGIIAARASNRPLVVSLQNGIDNKRILREELGQDHRVLAGTVTFNVVQTRKEGEAPRVHRASSGAVLIESGAPGLRDLLAVQGFTVREHAKIEPILWAKLLLNLNNALNALSGLPLAKELGDRRWRLLLREQMREALAVLAAAGIRTGRIEGIHPRVSAFALGLPDPIFALAARRMLAIDPAARSSMWEDLEARRPTEIEQIQGEIVKLATAYRVPAPLNERVMRLIKEAEQAEQGSPRLNPEAIG
jgi:2-dehydropantoate 2-reductase